MYGHETTIFSSEFNMICAANTKFSEGEFYPPGVYADIPDSSAGVSKALVSNARHHRDRSRILRHGSMNCL